MRLFLTLVYLLAMLHGLAAIARWSEDRPGRRRVIVALLVLLLVHTAWFVCVMFCPAARSW